ncbi:BolA/IbaG family iron-sulfur metabolism protein [Candidatus Pelagibacter communis]|uniref:BolA/IbaG family iron-sulfur metabolism protein n=1 Tax=Pelagibacter ubique TaxID=198252 RepID=UPI0009E60092|nr:BolA/IbaG family iron-sulfur metabolism protein [Candidatus Pelagibacter ubique]
MEINKLIELVEKKILDQIKIDGIKIEDKSFLHQGHKENSKNKFHLKISIFSKELMNKSKVEVTKKIYKILQIEMKEYIHSLQLIIN